MAKTSTATFQVAYGGPALREGTMDVRELAPALLAIGQACERANEVLNGSRASVSVRVKADFKGGSVGVALVLVQDLVGAVKDILSGDAVTTANEIAQLIGYGVASVSATAATALRVIKWLRGRPLPDKEDDGTIKLDIKGDGNQVLVVPSKVVRMVEDPPLRQELEATLEPLNREGIDSFEIRDGDEVVDVVEADEVEYFETPDLPESEAVEAIPETTGVYAFEIANTPFRRNLKWRLEAPGMNVTAEMRDPEFIRRMEAGESFRLGDTLVVRLRTKTFQAPGKPIRATHVIDEVIRHAHRSEQLSIPDPGDETS